MPAYIVVKIDVTDMEQYKKYMALTPELIAKFGGKFLTRGGRKETLEGDEVTERMVLLEFPSFEVAQQFYASEGYQNAKKLREGAAFGTFILLEGLA